MAKYKSKYKKKSKFNNKHKSKSMYPRHKSRSTRPRFPLIKSGFFKPNTKGKQYTFKKVITKQPYIPFHTRQDNAKNAKLAALQEEVRKIQHDRTEKGFHKNKNIKSIFKKWKERTKPTKRQQLMAYAKRPYVPKRPYVKRIYTDNSKVPNAPVKKYTYRRMGPTTYDPPNVPVQRKLNFNNIHVNNKRTNPKSKFRRWAKTFVHINKLANIQRYGNIRYAYQQTQPSSGTQKSQAVALSQNKRKQSEIQESSNSLIIKEKPQKKLRRSSRIEAVRFNRDERQRKEEEEESKQHDEF